MLPKRDPTDMRHENNLFEHYFLNPAFGTFLDHHD